MSWFFLFIAGLFEVGWPIGLKMIQNDNTKIIGVLLSVVCLIVSGSFLFLAQRSIPMGIAYAIWTAIGAAGTFLIGVLYYKEYAIVANYLGIVFIIIGVGLLKLGH